jgi:nucleoid DNA-binding protein
MSTGKSKAGREELVGRVQTALNYATKKEAENTLDKVIEALEATLLANLSTDKFSLKLNSFGKFTVKHKDGIYRKIPFTGETKMTSAKRKVKFVTLGDLRKNEAVPKTSDTQNGEN